MINRTCKNKIETIFGSVEVREKRDGKFMYFSSVTTALCNTAMRKGEERGEIYEDFGPTGESSVLRFFTS